MAELLLFDVKILGVAVQSKSVSGGEPDAIIIVQANNKILAFLVFSDLISIISPPDIVSGIDGAANPVSGHGVFLLACRLLPAGDSEEPPARNIYEKA